MKIVECKEHEQLSLPIEELIAGGRIALDPRVAQRGYLDVAISGGRIGLRTTRFVGLIPLTSDVAVRVTPKIPGTVLSELIIRSGSVPSIIVDFGRGYLPSFNIPADVLSLLIPSFQRGVETIVSRGLMKRYVSQPFPPPWKGKLALADTIRRYRARGLRHKASFEYTTLSYHLIENVALREALEDCSRFVTKDKRAKEALHAIKELRPAFDNIPRWEGRIADLLRHLADRATRVPANYAYYDAPLWVAYSILQQKVPAPEAQGYAKLDSLIVDVALAFESFVRETLKRGAIEFLWRVDDGNKSPTPLFLTTNKYAVHPDAVVQRDGKKPVVIEVKYKIGPKENDRYELLSFMEAIGADVGIFICPDIGAGHANAFVGRTLGSKRIYIVRVKIDSLDFDQVEAKLRADVAALLD